MHWTNCIYNLFVKLRNFHVYTFQCFPVGYTLLMWTIWDQFCQQNFWSTRTNWRIFVGPQMVRGPVFRRHWSIRYIMIHQHGAFKKNVNSTRSFNQLISVFQFYIFLLTVITCLAVLTDNEVFMEKSFFKITKADFITPFRCFITLFSLWILQFMVADHLV